MMISRAFKYPKVCYEKGVKIVTMRATHVFPDAKTLNYQTAVVTMTRAKKQGAEEALYIDSKGKIYEATRCNFFAVIAGKLVTTKAGVLMGVTRKVVIEIAKKLMIPVVEGDLYENEIPKFKEAFITASNKEVMPVVRIDEKRIRNGKVGKINRMIMDKYKKYND